MTETLREEDDVCGTCGGSGIVVENAGACGGCERCGSSEEVERSCPDCVGLSEEDEADDQS